MENKVKQIAAYKTRDGELFEDREAALEYAEEITTNTYKVSLVNDLCRDYNGKFHAEELLKLVEEGIVVIKDSILDKDTLEDE